MTKQLRLTFPTLKVLAGLLRGTALDLSGADLARSSRLASGTIYPILFRLERAKWVRSRWGNADPPMLGRPRRRFYRLTKLGSKRARNAISDLTRPMTYLSGKRAK